MKLGLLVLIVFCPFSLYAQSFDGYYEGLEKIYWKNDKGKSEYFNPPLKWNHFNQLSIKHDSVYLYRCPVIVKRRDTIHSASDGAFYYHYGLVLKSDSGYMVSYYKQECDYCAIKKKKAPVTGKLVPVSNIEAYNINVIEGGLEINGVKYGRKLMSLMN